MSASPFGRRFVVWVIPIVALSLLATLIGSVLGPELFEPTGIGGTGYSRSALGHRAFVRLLERVGIETELSRANSSAKARDDGLLVVAEPTVFDRFDPTEEDFAFEDPLTADEILFFAPKRTALFPDGKNPRFAGEVGMLTEPEVERSLDALSEAIGRPAAWTIERPRAPLSWSSTILEGTPALSDPQLLRHPDLEPWLECERGILIGVLRGSGGQRVTVVSDPDLIANHGIGRGDGTNARLAVELVEKVRPPGGRVIFDETCHGSGLDGGFWREAFRFPMVLVLIQAGILCALVFWNALGRFGTPEEERIGLEPGNRRLVRSTAELLHFGGHRGEAIGRYLRLAVDAVCRRLHGPATGSLDDKIEWLGGREADPEGDSGIRALARRVARLETAGSDDAVRTLALAIDRWRWEIVHGPEADRRGR